MAIRPQVVFDLEQIGVLLLFRLNPARIGDVAAGFDGELAHKAKHGETASEMKSQPK